MNTFFSAVGKVVIIPALVFSVAACDSGSDDPSSFQVNGKVTDDAGYGKALAPIEGAVVTAATMNANGSLNDLEGEATTDASGAYTLDLEVSEELLVVEAESATYTGGVLVYRGRELDKASPMSMNVETTAEADVYAQVRARGESASFVDVIAFVDKTVAAEIAADADIAAEVAAAIGASEDGEDEYVDRENIDRKAEKEDERDDREKEAFLALQSSLAAATSASAETAALETFEEALVDAYIDAGFSAETQARARQSSQAAIAHFGTSPSLSADGRFALNKRLAVMTALAVSKAVEASFEAAGASATRLAAVAAAGETWVSGTRSASSQTSIDTGFATFSSSIEAELAAEINVTSSAIETAKAAMSAAKTAFDASVSTAIDAASIAQAHIAFYVAAETAVETSLSGSGDAQLGAEIVALLALSN